MSLKLTKLTVFGEKWIDLLLFDRRYFWFRQMSTRRHMMSAIFCSTRNVYSQNVYSNNFMSKNNHRQTDLFKKTLLFMNQWRQWIIINYRLLFVFCRLIGRLFHWSPSRLTPLIQSSTPVGGAGGRSASPSVSVGQDHDSEDSNFSKRKHGRVSDVYFPSTNVLCLNRRVDDRVFDQFFNIIKFYHSRFSTNRQPSSIPIVSIGSIVTSNHRETTSWPNELVSSRSCPTYTTSLPQKST